jgi:hypothetical protein
MGKVRLAILLLLKPSFAEGLSCGSFVPLQMPPSRQCIWQVSALVIDHARIASSYEQALFLDHHTPASLYQLF